MTTSENVILTLNKDFMQINWLKQKFVFGSVVYKLTLPTTLLRIKSIFVLKNSYKRQFHFTKSHGSKNKPTKVSLCSRKFSTSILKVVLDMIRISNLLEYQIDQIRNLYGRRVYRKLTAASWIFKKFERQVISFLLEKLLDWTVIRKMERWDYSHL